MAAKMMTLIALETINHDGEDVAAGDTLEVTEKQGEQLMNARVAVPNGAEGKKYAKVALAAPTPDVVTDDKAPTAEARSPAGKSSTK